MDAGGDGVAVDAHNLIADLSINAGLDEKDTINVSLDLYCPDDCHQVSLKGRVQNLSFRFISKRFISYIQCKYDIKTNVSDSLLLVVLKNIISVKN